MQAFCEGLALFNAAMRSAIAVAALHEKISIFRLSDLSNLVK
jgi:hypothetical protein